MKSYKRSLLINKPLCGEGNNILKRIVGNDADFPSAESIFGSMKYISIFYHSQNWDGNGSWNPSI